MQDDAGEGVSPSGIYHEVEFDDLAWNRLHRQPWSKPFDPTEARKGVEVHGKSGIAKVTTTIQTDIQADDDRTETERVRVKKAGFLRNPDVEISSFFQVLTIESKQLIAALRALVEYYPSARLETDPVGFLSPFCVLAHHIDELESYKEALSNKEQLGPAPERQGELSDIQREVTVDHLGQLLHFMKHNMFSRQLAAEQARHIRGPPVCTFSMLWLLYKPGTTVYVRDDSGKTSAYIILSVVVDGTFSATLERSDPYEVRLWSLSFDGTYVRRAMEVITIGSFDGERPIMDLKIIPASFVDAADGNKTRQELIQRGGKWYGMLAGAQQWHYSGQTLDKTTLSSRKQSRRRHFGLIIVWGHIRRGRHGENLAICSCETCRGCRPHPPKGFRWTDYDIINPETDDLRLPEGHPDRDHRYLLCSGKLKGFSLKTRTWGTDAHSILYLFFFLNRSNKVTESLDVERCKPANINPKALDTLVMSDERKRMIKAIVQKYTGPTSMPVMSGGRWGADFIQTKGEGQIFLLHGGPGVGKTYVRSDKIRTPPSKCIAELIGRPLLSLTCADLGTDEQSMEHSLSKWFKLAEQWGAVMLLDEADIWLERRMVSDLKRNTLVAVFLRCLEYYRGILFLTSNRVGTFDDAFISRIHVVIHYEDLEEPQRKQIWKQFFDKLERERKDSIIVESRAKHFVLNDSEMRKLPWNGREIRNAFQTAVSLAEYRFYFEGGKDESDKIVLDKMDFEQVCQMSLEFKKYLTQVHSGDDENDRAMRQRARA
ncbi:hypothetical protein PG985_003597 [Apiospora marii]|uniref:uncharacterized protein n=1 Tax=Apiospora marii TaxID=335849 RepID=UPI00312DE322